jgi:hypothetical protein
VLDLAIGLDQLPDVVPAEVAERRPQLLVPELAGERGELAAPSGQALAQLRRLGAQEALVLLVGHLVDASPQRVASRALEQALEPAPVLDGDHLPAGRLEHSGEAPESDVRHDPVERLTVQVHHPQHLAEARDPGVGDRLPDGALVELGVPEQGDLAPTRRRLEAVVLEVAARDRSPDRGGRADADRAGRVVHRVGVLRPAWVALKAAEGAQRLEVGPVQAAEQVVDRVQHRRGVRLHRDAVLRAQLGEPQRGHQAHHRRARRLVAADLHARLVLTHAVGVMDDRGGEPEHAPLYGLERLEVRRRGLLRLLARGLGTSQHERSSHP